jgi:hypothetical protein
MIDSTYTAKGHFDQNGLANISVCIPAERSSGEYTTELFNLSKKTATGVINVIFCHFRNQSPHALQHTGFDYPMTFNADKLSSGSSAVSFDATKTECLFIFFHNQDFDSADRDLYFSEIENIYDVVKNQGNQSQDGLVNLTTSATQLDPRKVGMSLVTKGR